MMDYGQNEVAAQGMDQLTLFGREGVSKVRDSFAYMGYGILFGFKKYDNIHQAKRVKADQAESISCAKTQRYKRTFYGQ